MNAGTRRTLFAIPPTALALLGAGTAVATTTINVPSTVTIASSGLHFTGKVKTASYPPCAQQRKVNLFRVVKHGPDQKVGSHTTNNKGKWSITPQGSAGISLARFYAKVKQSSQGAAGTIYVCKAARSATIKPS